MGSGNELLELRKQTGLNRREFAEYFEIPYRTIHWELGNREMPEYLLRLIADKLKVNELAKKEKKGEERTRTELCELTCMVMVYDDAGNVLVQDKKGKSWSGVNFPAGMWSRRNRLYSVRYAK